MENNYAILIADIKSSRVYNEEERLAIQERLKKIVDLLNYIFSRSLVLPLDFSAGDSVQGIFKSPEASLRCYFVLQNLFFPVIIRGGIGCDKIYESFTNSGDFKDTNEIDGSAYHLAREAIEIAKAKKYDVAFFSKANSLDVYLNNMLMLSSNLKSCLSRSQRDLFRLCSFLSPILSEEELLKYESRFSDMLPFFDFSPLILNKYMYQEKLYSELLSIFNINKTNIEFYHNCYMLDHVFIADLVSRSSDGYLAKFYNVTPQNISSLRRRGKMNTIKTLDILSSIYLWKEFNHD